ncbi:MAG: DUF4340 domain-containing protein [Phycisphaerales bacterium]
MQSRVAIISLVVAIVLGLLTVVAYRTPRGPRSTNSSSQQTSQSTPTPLARLDPITVSKLEVIDASGKLVRSIERTELGWIATSDTINWPVDAGQARGLARLISDAAKQPIVEDALPPNATILKITSDSGTPIEIAISPTALAGSTLIFEKIPGGNTIARKASGDWNALLSKQSLDAWRSRRPLAVQTDTAKSITIKSGSREMTLARDKGPWRMTAPKAVPADTDATNKLIEGLAAVTAERFVESGSSLAAIEQSFATPVATVRVISSIPGTATKGDVEQLLEVGGPADASGSQFFARTTATATWDKKPLWGPLTVVLTRQAIESLVQDPAGYVSKRSVQVPSADVVQLSVVNPVVSQDGTKDTPGFVLYRDANGWTIGSTSDFISSGPRPLKDGEALGQLPSLLCDTPASAVIIDPKLVDPKLAATYQQFGDLQLMARGDIRHKDMTIGQLKSATGKTLLVVKDLQSDIWRVYEGSADPDKLIAPIAAALNQLIKN